MSLPSTGGSMLLLHNPKCSKSRATKELLDARGVEYETRLYLEAPLDRHELAELGRRLGRAALEFTRTRQAEFGAAGLGDASSEDEVFAAIESQPILMERPILVSAERAILGRPPEDVLALLDD